jgi:hypothetical protein
MNRRRTSEPRSNFPAYLALLLMAGAGTLGGVLHAIYRNDQVHIEREIAKTRERIEEHRLDIQMLEVRTERELDRYEIRAQLELRDSALVSIGHGVVQKVESVAPQTDPPVALRRP